VGVVERPRSTTFNPKPSNVLLTKLLTISPEILASRPITIFFPPRFFTQVPKAAANFTTSTGVSASLGLPPIVPRMPEMDFINVTVLEIWQMYNLRPEFLGYDLRITATKSYI